MKANSPLIKIEDAAVVIGGNSILAPVNFAVQPGEKIAILGPNGAGKSTLIQLLNGELHPYAGIGSVSIEGKTRIELKRKRTALVTVSADLESKLIHDPKVEDLVLSGRLGGLGVFQGVEPTPVDWLGTETAMAMMGIEHLRDRLVSTLSSGERRRAWIARALATSPKALILDEPTANLDEESRLLLHEKLAAIAKNEIAILMVTHHVEDVTPMFGRVVLIQQGTILFDGSREEAIQVRNRMTVSASAGEKTAPESQVRQVKAHQPASPMLPKTPSPQQYLEAMRSVPVYDVAQESPLQLAPVLSHRLGCKVLLKREDLQDTFSFKVRGSYAKIASLTEEERQGGVVTASAGNHALGVALASKKLGIPATIVVPTTTPQIKKEGIRSLGAKLLLQGDNYDEAFVYAKNLAEQENLPFIHPYDHAMVIAGQGTIGLEIDQQYSDPIDAIFVAVGGGGLISGIALALKQLRPGIKVIGVEPEDACAMQLSLAKGERVTLNKVGLLADGVAVKTVGAEPFRIASQWVDEVLTVSNDAICGAVRDIFEDCRALLEPSGALAYAGLKQYAANHSVQGQTFVAVACGANVTFERIQYVAERSRVGERKEALLACRIPEEPGSFRSFCLAIGPKPITEFNYRMGDRDQAMVFAGVGVQNDEERTTILNQLKELNYEAIDLTEDELAATHLRHMVGGRSSLPNRERLYHFDFPERAGALFKFLDKLNGNWNISLFHYRNHGSDQGRVLVGFEVPESTNDAFIRFLEDVDYPWTEVTDNPGLTAFLSPRSGSFAKA